MITVRKSSDRGHFNHGWLDTYHTFSFGRYYDAAHVHFGTLRVINEDVVAPGAGFGQHPHDNMEIITYIVSGAIAHRDTAGHTATITRGGVQHMSAGTGIQHSEFNPSPTDPVHMLQIWIEPKAPGLTPAFHEARFDEADRTGTLRVLASPDGTAGSIPINQDARLYSALLRPGESIAHHLATGRHAWVQVVRGGIDLNGTALAEGDGAAVSGEVALRIAADKPTELLGFDLA